MLGLWATVAGRELGRVVLSHVEGAAVTERWFMQPDEKFNSLVAAVPYVAACPACGADAKWRDVLVNVSSPSMGCRSVVQPEIECGQCGPIEGVRFDVES